ncbi:hypothetical protein BXU06_08455 [Aquaspirillum sp. LM1]|nr:hypothetical protein BXU06_08455 [Aquaspirillum sp. LM1]
MRAWSDPITTIQKKSFSYLNQLAWMLTSLSSTWQHLSRLCRAVIRLFIAQTQIKINVLVEETIELHQSRQPH